MCRTVAAYQGDVLTAQFAYDDTITNYRQSLQGIFLRHATALLAHPPDDLAAGTLASLAHRVSQLAPQHTNPHPAHSPTDSA